MKSDSTESEWLQDCGSAKHEAIRIITKKRRETGDMRMKSDSTESEWLQDCGSAKHEAIRIITGVIKMDPHIQQFQNNEFGAETEGSMEDMLLARRAEKLYRTLSERGEFSKLDKAKHNEQYRNYLLQNFDDYY